MEELRALWKARLAEGEQDAIAEARRGRETTSPGAMQGMDYALSHCFERQSAVPEKELLKTALIHSVGTASVNEVHDELARPISCAVRKPGPFMPPPKKCCARKSP